MNEGQNANGDPSRPCLRLKKFSAWLNLIKKNRVFIVLTPVIILALGWMGKYNTAKTFIKNLTPSHIQSKESYIDCTNLSDNTWIKDENITTDKQYLFLKDNQQIGSIRFYKTFFDTFILKLRFIPYGIEGINMTISIKDDSKNELGITIGDGDYKFYRVVIKKEGKTIKEKSSQLNSAINSTEEVLFQLGISQSANSLFANSFVMYTPNKKPGKKISTTLLQENIPYFPKNLVRLNIGLRKTAGVNNPKIKLINGEIYQIIF